MKKVNTKVFLLGMIILCGACSTYHSLDVYSVDTSKVFLGVPIKNDSTLASIYLSRFNSIHNNQIKIFEDSNYIKSEALKLLLTNNFGNMSKVVKHKMVINLMDAPMQLKEVDSTLNFKPQFLKNMPSSFPRWDKLSWFTLIINTKYDHNYHIFYVSDSTLNQFIKAPGQFEYQSNYFPNNFIYPRDLLSVNLCPPIGIDNFPTHLQCGYYNNSHQIYYLMLPLPKGVILRVRYTHNFYRSRSFGEIGFFNDGLGLQLLRDNKALIFNPAFTGAYKFSTQALWELNLFNIKYDILKDTATFLGIIHLSQWDSLCPGSDCPGLNLYSPDVKTYLQKVINHNPEMYKSYFELIFWQMYQPKDFEIKDNRGEERSFTFTSTSERFPGKYKVKFNIYRPYEFKVKRK